MHVSSLIVIGCCLALLFCLTGWTLKYRESEDGGFQEKKKEADREMKKSRETSTAALLTLSLVLLAKLTPSCYSYLVRVSGVFSVT